MKPEKKERLLALSIEKDKSLHYAFKKMDEDNLRLLCVTSSGRYLGVISAGDIQRAIIANGNIDNTVGSVLRSDIRVANEGDRFSEIKEMMLRFRTEFMPVVDSEGGLVDIYFWDEVFQTCKPEYKKIQVPVVIMAGGKGTRLKPFSNVLPKPLFPLGDKTILEVIMDRFAQFGCENFYLSLNHKADFIRSYLDQLDELSYSLEYFQETKPLGTAGSLHLIREEIKDTFFVSNCDIVIDTDYCEIVDYHREHENEITLVAALKHIQIPYGTLKTGAGGVLEDFQEKPELTYMINSGLYLLEPHLLKEVPEDTFFHITDLIEKVKTRGGKVGVFPVSEMSWSDIGEWQEYGATIKRMGLTE